MATTDSGTETLFSSDDSSTSELLVEGSPNVCYGGEDRHNNHHGIDNDTDNNDNDNYNKRQQQQQQQQQQKPQQQRRRRFEIHEEDEDVGSSEVNGRAPPNIQPFSGVLEKGKVVIRPIAFKPAANSSSTATSTSSVIGGCGAGSGPAGAPGGMTPAARFGLAGSERYGSTPILTRPGSRLTLYGSTNDLRQQQSNNLNHNNNNLNYHHNINNHYHHHNHHHHNNNNSNNNMKNYSLDRKLRSSCCPSTTSTLANSTSTSPPLAMSSLTSPQLVNYDSLESVRKSPMSITADSTIMMNKSCSSYRLSGEGGGSLLDLTPSPSDSGVSELEAALRDRDSELAYLRQTMEHNEQVIFRVYQEKEKVWDRELRRLKTVHENRLRSSAQKILKLEQMLMMQTYQLQQDKKRLFTEAQRANCQSDRLRQEVQLLRSRLEETEWGVCQKTGEISLLKSQLKEYQNEQNSKCQELLQMRNEHREMRDLLSSRDTEISELKEESHKKDQEIHSLKQELIKLQLGQEEKPDIEEMAPLSFVTLTETERLKAEIRELREELSDMSLNEYGGVEPGRTQRMHTTNNNPLKDEKITHEPVSENTKSSFQIINYNPEVEKLREEMDLRTKDFENERLIWAQEKEKVLRYQRQLQMNYIQMYRRTRALEAEVESLTIELELDKSGVSKKLSSGEMTHTIEL